MMSDTVAAKGRGARMNKKFVIVREPDHCSASCISYECSPLYSSCTPISISIPDFQYLSFIRNLSSTETSQI